VIFGGGRCSAGGKCPVLGDERADRDDGQCTVQKQQQQQQQWQRRRIGGASAADNKTVNQ